MSAVKATTGPAGAPLRAWQAANAREQPSFRPPMVGGWELTRLVGVGRWSRVFRARPVDAVGEGLGDYAVKLLAPEHAENPIARASMRREAQVCRTVENPHLLTVLADHSGARSPHLVVPFVEGVALSSVLERKKGVPINGALWFVRQIGEALSGLHAVNWLHGNVSPRDVLVSPSGHVTLVGCGQARRVGTAECGANDAASGDPRYGSPESFSRSGTLSPASDIYGVGIVLYELLGGELPFAGRSAAELAKQHRLQAPPPIRQLRPQLSREIAELVQRMLAKEPLRRPSSADLVRWLTELEIAEMGL